LPKEANVKLVVGLGNPGSAYENTRHNIGFEVISALVARRKERLRKVFGLSGLQVCIKEEPAVRFLQPMAYMNRSGLIVRRAMRRWRISPADLVVIYDDIDVNWGEIRVRAKGSAGTHNGMRSIVEQIGTEQFSRIRVGMGPKPKEIEIIDFVLGRYSPQEDLELEKVVDGAADAVESLISTGIDKAMSAFNGQRLVEER
jgi:PTH1 family peptidyl-tRNA hydrolase